MLVSPAEPSIFHSLGTVSSVPETMGADFLFNAQNKLIGVQRKQFNDLLASVADGRLAKESSQMQRLGMALIIIEGKPFFTSDGKLLDRYSSAWTRDQLQALYWSLQARGIWITFTDSIPDTIRVLERFKTWSEKDSHATLFSRPKAPTAWGQRTDEDTQLWILQSIDGIGPERAKVILKHFGALPIGWKIPKEALLTVPGLGPKTVERIWNLFEGGTDAHTLCGRRTPQPAKAKDAPTRVSKTRKRTPGRV